MPPFPSEVRHCQGDRPNRWVGIWDDSRQPSGKYGMILEYDWSADPDDVKRAMAEKRASLPEEFK